MINQLNNKWHMVKLSYLLDHQLTLSPFARCWCTWYHHLQRLTHQTLHLQSLIKNTFLLENSKQKFKRTQYWARKQEPTLGFGLILKWVSPKTHKELRRRQRRWVEEDGGRERKEEEEEEEGDNGERGETEGVGVTLVEWGEESVVGNIVAYSEIERERERERERDGFGCKEMNWVGNFNWLIPNDKRTPLLQIGVLITGPRAKTGTFHVDRSIVLGKE